MIKQYKEYSLLHHNTLGIDVKTASFVDFSSVEALQQFLSNGFQTPLLVIGGGSNLLFTSDFNGTVFHSSIMDITVVEEDENTVPLGEQKPKPEEKAAPMSEAARPSTAYTDRPVGVRAWVPVVLLLLSWLLFVVRYVIDLF